MDLEENNEIMQDDDNSVSIDDENDLEYVYDTINTLIDDSFVKYYSHNYKKNLEMCLDLMFGEVDAYHYKQHISNVLLYNDIPEYTIPLNTNTESNAIESTIELLKSKPQPDQKSDEWYIKRKNMMTASNLWKVFKSESTRNSIIYEKCNVNSKPPQYYGGPMEWGNKYEPISVMLYEYEYKTKVDDFGCITHDKYEYIGASPDGINVDVDSSRYGRMLEIKNIVNREITGIPKEEYWVQMQIQMETCNLDYCDFFETRFKEYETEQLFYENDDKSYKGVILQFIKKPSLLQDNNDDGYKPFYVYQDINQTINKETIELWIDAKQIEYTNSHVLIKKYYYYLDEMSCVLVKRNKKWFEIAAPLIEDTWNTILMERETGYEHRATKPRKKIVIESDNNNIKIIRNLAVNNVIETIKLC